METWFIIILIFLCISTLFKPLVNLLLQAHSNTSTTKFKLPPGPNALPIIGNISCLHTSIAQLPTFLRTLRSQYGSLFALNYGSHPVIFIADHSAAHQALIKNGATFANRLPPLTFTGMITNNIINTSYGSKWVHLRRNLMSILSPPRVKSSSYSSSRKWVLEILINKLKCLSAAEFHDQPICVVDHFEDTIFQLLVLLCFGHRLNEEKVSEICMVQQEALVNFNQFSVFNFWPGLWKILFRDRWNKILWIRERQKELMIPLIRERKKLKETSSCNGDDEEREKDFIVSYVDTLLDLVVPMPDEKRKLDEDDIVSLCSEFLNAGKDTTATALQWIMANLVKHPHIQAKLFAEINGVLEINAEANGAVEYRKEEVLIKEEDLQKMPYLKAVILEGLRRHPPSHLVVPHTTTKDVTLNGYIIPKNSIVNFMVADMGWNPNVWEDPMEFKPERFLTSNFFHNTNGGKVVVFDITGKEEIKMMPFGAGRRICPGSGFALLHLEYFVANLVKSFEWIAVDGEAVDLSEENKFMTVMKNPLRARLSPRFT